MIQLAIEYRQAEKNTPPVSNIQSIMVDVTYLFVDSPGLYDQPTHPPVLRLLPEGAQERSTQRLGSGPGPQRIW